MHLIKKGESALLFMKGFKTASPRVLISAPQGRSGKTIVSLGVCAALRHRGLAVQPFKRGPDYIDPSWLTAAAGRNCRNLDLFLIPEKELLPSFLRASQGADLALIEGAMGLYDGLDQAGWGSTAHVARILNAPVILTVNTARMTSSIAAMVTGYQRFQPDINIVAVILSNVSSSRHEQKLKAAVEQYCGIPVLGSIPRDEHLCIPQRHLGIIPNREDENSSLVIDQIRRRLEDCINLEAILDIARGASSDIAASFETQKRKEAVVRIGVMLDRVFTFYYPENLEALTQAGAELVFIDSLQEQQLPEVDGLYIGGGFPELFSEELEANRSLRQNIAQAIEEGLPVYAECAGLMYLCRNIQWHGHQHEMVGVFPSEVEICEKPQGHGYVVAEVTGENPLFPIGLMLHGHEFHYSRLSQFDGLKSAYHLHRGRGIDGKADAIIYKNVFAAYTHLHSSGVPQWAESFVALVLRERRREPVFS
ncbi:cobyrinate a,c-diamide synthase [Chloroflexota bacterium]